MLTKPSLLGWGRNLCIDLETLEENAQIIEEIESIILELIPLAAWHTDTL